MSVPTARELVEFIAAHEPLQETRRHFGLTADEVRARLIALAPLSVSPKKPKQASMSFASPERLLLFCDGASRGNPGTAGAGAVLKDASGKVVARLGKLLGEATNNVAEYEGLLLGLRHARKLGAKEIEIAADSQLLVRQIEGKYKVKNPALRVLHQTAMKLLGEFDHWSVRHVYREQNTEADEMSNRAIDEKMVAEF
jgi:ribonuclease HI